MATKFTQSLGEAVAANVKHWRNKRRLDQQGLADRLHELGWKVDRTAIARIERGPDREGRKVTVDELGMLAVALNVPISVLLLPITKAEGGDGPADVQVTPAGGSVNRWWLFETMLGNEPYPGRAPNERNLVEFDLAAWPLKAYGVVRRAQREADQALLGQGEKALAATLQALVDAIDLMEHNGYPAQDLADMFGVGPDRKKAIAEHGIRPTPPFDELGQASKGGAQ